MLRRIVSFVLLGAMVLSGPTGCRSSEDPLPPGLVEAAPIDFEIVAGVLLDRLSLQAGERTLLVGRPGRFDPLVPLLRAGITAAGAVDLGAWAVGAGAPDTWASDFTGELADLEPADLVDALTDVDAAVMLPGATAGQPVYSALQNVLRTGRGRTVHFHWQGAYNLDGTARLVDSMVDAFYLRVLAETDYPALARAQRAFEVAMRGATVRVTTPAGTDISFDIGDRPVTKQDGDASAARAAAGRNLIDREIELPAGAIRVAPIEETVAGRIAFPPSVWQGQPVEGLVLTFDRGVVTDLETQTGEAAVLAELDAAGGGYVRWNFFVDATVSVDGVEWVRDGSLVR